MSNNQSVYLQCDCKCATLVIDKQTFDDGDISYNISVMDSRYDHNFNTVWGRIKRATKVLFGKPIYYNDIYIDSPDKFNHFLKELSELKTSDNINEEG